MPSTSSPPSILSYDFYSAVLAGLAACACFYAGLLPTGHLSGLSVLAPVWAGIVTHIDIKTTADWCCKSIAAAIIGAVVGIAVGSAVHAVVSVDYVQYVGVIVMIPFAMVLALSEPSTGCKLTHVYRYDVALVTSYVVVAFGPGDVLTRSLVICLTFVAGSLVPLALVVLANAVWEVPRATAPALPAFATRAAVFFEMLATLAMTGENQAEWLDKERLEFEKVWGEALSVVTADPHLRAVIYRMAAELFAMRKTIRGGLYSEGILEVMWNSLLADITELRLKVVFWLRTLTRPKIRDPKEVEGPHLKENAAKLEALLLEKSLDYSRLQVSGRSRIVPAEDVVRFQYACSAMTRFAVLAQEFHEILRAKEEDMDGSRRTRLSSFWKYMKRVLGYWKHWLRSPWFSSGPFSGKISARLAFPVRLGLSLTIACILVITWARAMPSMAPHALWGVLPVMFCLVPTAGASLVKGTRRMVGTVLASGIAIACVAIHPHNMEAFFVELFIITFVGKLASFKPKIGYAGLVFSLTWTIISVMPATFDGDEPFRTVLASALWRMALTSAGVAAATVMSWIVFPTFSTTKLERVTAWELVSQVNLVTTALEQLVGIHQPEGSSEAVGPEVGGVLYLSSAERHALESDAKAEAAILGKLGALGLSTLRVLDVQGDIDRLGRSAIVAHVAMTDCAMVIEDPAAGELLEPLKGLLSGIVMALKDSVSRVVLFIVDTSNLMPDGLRSSAHMRDPGVQLQRTYDAFVGLREKLITLPVDGNSDLMANVLSSGGIRFYHAIYALSLFIEDWRDIESSLRGFDGGPARVVDAVDAVLPEVEDLAVAPVSLPRIAPAS
ncbi:hypothetical protein FOZ63_016161 [Perkinsus olseni]|uniref:Aluminum-activated malate transporter 1 n=1 Tax=Perkinsus olseni TaxID=32597 RepID=A0A7J6TD48_PEROL|nr:hypothetical protein FOZ63_016161 [Perkinsus olseni]